MVSFILFQFVISFSCQTLPSPCILPFAATLSPYTELLRAMKEGIRIERQIDRKNKDQNSQEAS